ncbi:dihydroxyacetone kinase [Paenibacillus popilliae ATCC 14706]|uniref:Dihydroxyacetone kinase n=1 Tax=Paenibacillus popilliae ATCC 14706 TaxID=1212764 RepID=M9LH98_PAEPP|nr:dihydroxyacetone kinase [Paenibacillus popilliae ATCC 14706]
MLVHKIAGAAAEAGLELADVKSITQKAIDRTRSIGFALTSCTVPAKGTPTFELGEDEIEYGVGIHGEPGIRREKNAAADKLAKKMVADLFRDMKLDDGSAEELAVLVNGFGASLLQELYLLANAVVREIRSRHVSIFKVFVGNDMTSIDMAGASVSLKRLDEQLKHYLQADCATPALQVNGPFSSLRSAEAGTELQAIEAGMA